jgi:ribosomal protein L12E/L44/L45/RPP1/RPP2
VRTLCTVVKEIDGDEIEESIQWNSGVNTMQDIDFPPILEKDIQTSVQAVVTALTLNGQEIINLIPPEIGVRLILSALGQDDIDEIMAEIFPDDTTMPAGKGNPTPSPTLPQMSTSGGGSATPSEARIKEAARRFLEAVNAERTPSALRASPPNSTSTNLGEKEAE